jgi:hypothetical protein
MRLTAESRVRKCLQDLLYAELTTVLRLDPRLGARVLGLKSIRAMSTKVVDSLIENPKFHEALGQIRTTQGKEWLTTEEAAKISGFSRPFIVALLDSGTYKGAVNRTEKGHRRVLASDFREWIIKLGVIDLPRTVADVRTGVSVESETESATLEEKKARSRSRKRAIEVARKFGLS